MSGSQSKRNHRREARTRAEAPKSFMHALLPKRVGRAFALLTRTYHGCRQPGSNGAVGFTGIPNGMVRRFYRANGAVIRGGGGVPWNYTPSASRVGRCSCSLATTAENMISCQVCWRMRRWHNGQTRRSLNPYSEEVSQD